jgi:NRE family putative nickel resistance protein-like MFS transporter
MPVIDRPERTPRLHRTSQSRRNTVGYVELARGNANFRYLWFGQIISLLGDWFNLIASASLIGMLTESGLAVGGLFVVRMLAPFVVSPLAGVAADRMNRKRLLITADLTRAAVVLGFLLVRTPGQVWLLYTLTALQLGLSGFFFPARNAILPDLVTQSELGAANALTAATWSVMLAFGAALGGIVAGQWGLYPSFIVDSATFLASAFLLSHIDYLRPPALEGADARPAAVIGQYVDGLRYLWQHPDILALTLHKAATMLFVGGSFQVIQVQLAEQVFVIGEGGGTSLGIMYAVVGVGTGLGPIAARWVTGDRHRAQRIAIAVSYAITAAGLVIVASLASFGVVLVGTLLRGLGTGMMWVFSTQLLLELLPGEVRGRVFGTEFAMQTLMTAVSALIAGWALDRPGLDVQGILLVCGALILLPGVLWLAWNVRQHWPAPQADESPAK